MKTPEEILRKVLEADFANRKLTEKEWNDMPLKNHILKAMDLYAIQEREAAVNHHIKFN